ncbi:hypothetical protein [Marinicauda pacifica]|uniref:hypothetical protein n=1 Tax=Marinicauda pacifica TaxID=1133559 RepID=UPI0035C861FE
MTKRYVEIDDIIDDGVVNDVFVSAYEIVIAWDKATLYVLPPVEIVSEEGETFLIEDHNAELDPNESSIGALRKAIKGKHAIIDTTGDYLTVKKAGDNENKYFARMPYREGPELVATYCARGDIFQEIY